MAVEKKHVLAKLYDLRSYVGGKIAELQADMVEPEKVLDHVAVMVNRSILDVSGSDREPE